MSYFKFIKWCPLFLLIVFILNMMGCSVGMERNYSSNSGSEELEKRINELNKEILKNISKEDQKKIAVLEFANLNGQVTRLGKFLAEELITRLYKTNRFEVVERELLNKIIEEQKLSLSGMVDPQSAKEIGKILGVDAIVSGTVTDLGNSLKINARIISASSGEIFGVASQRINKYPVVKKLSGQEMANTIPGKRPRDNNTEKENSVQKSKVINDFKFEWKGFDIQDDKITIKMLVTNKAQDRKLKIYRGGQTRLYDNFGNEYSANKIVIANKSAKYALQHYMVSGIPTKASIQFNNLHPDIKKISLVKIRIRANEENSVLNYRDIQLNSD